MATPAIQSVVQHMQAMAVQAAGEAAKGQNIATTVGKGGFAAELHASIGRISQLQTQARAQARAFEAGDDSVALNDVMIDLQKASVAFQMGVQVRNRLVSAYRDIMNMQV
ncbi:MAG: flagellar hook-basal body complex protein FliE [Porticoccaceae bacterium]|jgi:flagellar hook-basal body complex protein FliE